MGNTLSDKFYPDNPNRRKRAEELYSDIKAIQREYEALREEYLRIVDRMEPYLNELLKSLGFKSLEELTQAARSSMSGEALAEFEKIQKRMDKHNRVDGIIAGVSSLAALGGAAVVGVLMMLGAITVATGGAALAALAAVFAIIAVAAIIAAAIQGAKIRRKLRENIRENFGNRREAKLALEQLRVTVYWSALFTALLQAVNVSKDPEYIIMQFQKFARILEGPKQMFDNVTMASIDQMLRKLDSKRRSWTKEDPRVHAPSIKLTNLAICRTTRSFYLANLAVPVSEPDAEKIEAEETEADETEAEGFAKVRLSSVQSEDGTEKDFTDNDNFFLEMETETTDRSAIVWLKKDGKYVTLYDEGDYISLHEVEKDEAEYFVEGQGDSLIDNSIQVDLVDLSEAAQGGRSFTAQAHFITASA